MKRWLALALILCCMAGCARAEKESWSQEEWQNVVEALVSDTEEPVGESRRVSFRSAWLPAAEKGFANLLLLSSDSSDIEKNFGRADAILVCRVNLRTGETRLLSLPEDALVTLPETPEPIALRYVNCFGGAGLTARCVNEALGLRISRFCAVNIDSFIKIVDSLGGVILELTEEEAEALELDRGKQKLDGEQALRYVEFRQAGDGSDRVRALLAAVLRQMVEDASVNQVFSLVDLLLPSIDTNLTTDDIIDLVFALVGQDKPAVFREWGLIVQSGSLDARLMDQSRYFLYGEE